MNTPQAGDRVEHLASSNGLRVVRKHGDRLLHGCVASTVSFQVQDPVVGVALTYISLEMGGHIDHWTVDMRTKEHPTQHGPRECLGEQALDGAVTPAFARPTGDAQHRDPAGHHQHSPSHPTPWA
jgi:hypothetical protein